MVRLPVIRMPARIASGRLREACRCFFAVHLSILPGLGARKRDGSSAVRAVGVLGVPPAARAACAYARPRRAGKPGRRIPSMSDPLVILVFLAAAAVSLATSWLPVSRLERIGARLGLSGALLGLLGVGGADGVRAVRRRMSAPTDA